MSPGPSTYKEAATQTEPLSRTYIDHNPEVAPVLCLCPCNRITCASTKETQLRNVLRVIVREEMQAQETRLERLFERYGTANLSLPRQEAEPSISHKASPSRSSDASILDAPATSPNLSHSERYKDLVNSNGLGLTPGSPYSINQSNEPSGDFAVDESECTYGRNSVSISDSGTVELSPVPQETLKRTPRVDDRKAATRLSDSASMYAQTVRFHDNEDYAGIVALRKHFKGRDTSKNDNNYAEKEGWVYGEIKSTFEKVGRRRRRPGGTDSVF